MTDPTPAREAAALIWERLAFERNVEIINLRKDLELERSMTNSLDDLLDRCKAAIALRCPSIPGLPDWLVRAIDETVRRETAVAMAAASGDWRACQSACLDADALLAELRKPKT